MNVITAGLHQDGFELDNPKYNTANWINGPATTTAAFSGGKTETEAAWLQDQIALTSQLKLTLGGRYEYWRAFDGVNASLSPVLSVHQPDLSASRFSPKAVLAYAPTSFWRLTASIGKAYRFADGAGALPVRHRRRRIAGPEPGPEAGGRHLGRTRGRAALVGRPCAPQPVRRKHLRRPDLPERRGDPANPSSIASFTQNVDRVRTRGVEIVAGPGGRADQGPGGSPGWITYVQSRILRDTGYAPTFAGDTVVGRQLPQLPRLRASAAATYRPAPAWAFTLAAPLQRQVLWYDRQHRPPCRHLLRVRGLFRRRRACALSGGQTLGGRSRRRQSRRRLLLRIPSLPQRTVVAKLNYSF